MTPAPSPKVEDTSLGWERTYSGEKAWSQGPMYLRFMTCRIELENSSPTM